MIVRCSNADQNFLEEYIGHRYPECLYLYFDLKKYGASSQYTSCWILKDHGIIKGVILLYHTAMHLFSAHNDFNIKEIIDFIIEHNPSIICASRTTIERIVENSPSDYEAEYGHVGMFHRVNKKCDLEPVKAGDADIEGIAKLLYEDDDIGASYTLKDLVEQQRERLNQGFVRSYVVKDNGQVVCHVGTGAENEKACTIAYCITDVAYRGRGLFSNLLTYVCDKLSKEGKEIYSIYYPENSRLLHHKVGFKDVCECGKLFKKIK